MKICVYTAVFGNTDIIIPPKVSSNDIAFLSFTDINTKFPEPWSVRDCPPLKLDSPRLMSRYLKINGPEILHEYDVSIWIDGNIRPLVDLRGLVDEFLETGMPIALMRHPARSLVSEEIEACEQFGKVLPAEVPALRRQLDRYLEDGFPGNGLIESNVIFRRHDATGLSETMKLWWSEVRDSSIRDQISLPYALWKTGLGIHHWDWSVRTINGPFSIHGHRYGPFNDLVKYVTARRNDAIYYRVLSPPLLLIRGIIYKFKPPK